MAPFTTARSAPRTRQTLLRLGALALVAMLATAFTASPAFAAKGGNHSSPTLSVITAARTVGSGVGGPLTISGEDFAPSSGGQMVILWVGYPDDYCAPDGSICHGFYAFPNVSDDGTFDMTFEDVTVTSGTGITSARQYSVRNDKWRTVATVEYIVP